MGEIARELSQNCQRELSQQFESLACVGGHISPKNTESGPRRPCVRCAAIQIARLASIRLTCVPRGIAEWLARGDCVRWMLAIGDWRFCPCKLAQMKTSYTTKMCSHGNTNFSELFDWEIVATLYPAIVNWCNSHMLFIMRLKGW